MIDLPAALQQFLHGIETANWDGIEAYLAPDVLYDATVPGWHYQYAGRDRIAEEYRTEWTGRHPWQLRELYVALTAEGAIVEFEARAHAPTADGAGTTERCARMANIFHLEDGRIVEHRLYCGGEWDQATIRRIEAHAPKVRQPDRVR